MLRNILGATVTVALGFSLAACDTGPRKNLDPNFGESVRRNIAIHVVDPAPKPAEAVSMDGTRGNLAVERYKKDTVKQPQGIGSLSGGGGGVGGAAGGGQR